MKHTLFLLILFLLPQRVFARKTQILFDPTKPPEAILKNIKKPSAPFKLSMVLSKNEEKPCAYFSIDGQTKKVYVGDHIEGFRVMHINEDSVKIQDSKGGVVTLNIHPLSS